MRRAPEQSARDDSPYWQEGRRNRASTQDVPRSRRYDEGARAASRAESYDVKPLSLRVVAILGGVVALACVLIIFVAVPLINADRDKTEESIRHAASEVSTLNAVEATASNFAVNHNSSASVHDLYIPTVQDMLGIPGSTDVITLDLADGKTAPAGTGAAIGNVRNAIAEVEEQGNCGFVFVDMGTGYGLAYNADAVMYIASASKAPFIYWLLTSGIELDEWERQELEWVITDSDNESFEDLYASHYDSDYENMMSAHGVPANDYWGNYYPSMSARSLAALWVEMQSFMQGGSSDAQWLAGLLGETTTSFINDGLEGTGAVVINKAGWISEDGGYYSEAGDGDYELFRYESVTDAGLVSIDGNVYLMVIATDQPDGDASEWNVSELARALFDARSAL